MGRREERRPAIVQHVIKQIEISSYVLTVVAASI